MILQQYTNSTLSGNINWEKQKESERGRTYTRRRTSNRRQPLSNYSNTRNLVACLWYIYYVQIVSLRALFTWRIRRNKQKLEIFPHTKITYIFKQPTSTQIARAFCSMEQKTKIGRHRIHIHTIHANIHSPSSRMLAYFGNERAAHREERKRVQILCTPCALFCCLYLCWCCCCRCYFVVNLTNSKHGDNSDCVYSISQRSSEDILLLVLLTISDWIGHVGSANCFDWIVWHLRYAPFSVRHCFDFVYSVVIGFSLAIWQRIAFQFNIHALRLALAKVHQTHSQNRNLFKVCAGMCTFACVHLSNRCTNTLHENWITCECDGWLWLIPWLLLFRMKSRGSISFLLLLLLFCTQHAKRIKTPKFIDRIQYNIAVSSEPSHTTQFNADFYVK